MYQIMIVEDDDKITDILNGYIEKYNYKTTRVQRFDDLKGEFLRSQPDLVLLDIILPYYDGFYWCRQIRGVSNVPFIFLSARVGDMDQVMANENGGDDYLRKPFHLDVVMAKIKRAIRRAYGEYAMSQQSDYVDINGLYLNRSKYVLEWQEKKVILTQKEFLLLDCLIRKNEQIVPREELLEVLWDDQEFVDDNTLTVNVTRVRKKLEELAILKK